MATHRIDEDGIAIRRRSRAPMVLPHFTSDSELLIDNARFDKLFLTRRYLLTQVPLDFDGASELASRVTEMQSSLASNEQGALAECCSAFRLVRQGNGEAKLKLPDHHADDDPRWLVDIEIELRHVRAAHPSVVDAGRPDIALRVNLGLNPSRILAHAHARNIDLVSASWEQALVSDPSTYARVALMSVNDRQDNILPIADFVQPGSINRVTESVEHLIRYVDGLMDHLIGVPLSGTRPAAGAWFAPTPVSWCLLQAETYWEFGQVDSIPFVRRLRPILWSIANDLSERSWSQEDGPEAVSFSMRANKDVRIALYAKTFDRIRLEVRHNSRLPGSARESVGDRLRRVGTDAVSRANQARNEILRRIEHMDANLSLREEVDMLCELVLLLSTAYPDDTARASDVLRLLLTRGGLRLVEASSAFSRREINRLRSVRILERSGFASPSRTDNFYPLALRYQALFEQYSGETIARDNDR